VLPEILSLRVFRANSDCGNDRDADVVPVCCVRSDTMDKNFYNMASFDVATLAEVAKAWYRTTVFYL
jgi:hypothetical protein